MAKKAKSVIEPKVDELAEVRKTFEHIAELNAKDRERYKADTHFLYVDHWPADVRARRNAEERLSLNVDKLSQYMHQVVNESRQNRPQIKVRPIDNDADIETAEIYDGLCRHIQERSNADTCYDMALECAVAGGFGFLRVNHDYVHENTFNQDLSFCPMPNPLQVYFGEHKEPDGSDVNDVFVCEDVPIDEFKRDHPDIDVSDWDTEGTKYGDWCGEKVRVAEYYRVVKEPRLMHLFVDGTVCSDEDYKLAIEQGVDCPAIKESRTIPQRVVMWSKLCGSGYIERERKTIWKWIPIVPVWGNTQNIDGEVRHVSMINNVKDAQLLYDYSRSAFAERVGQTPEAPWVAAAGQIEDYRDEWDGTKRVRVQRYDPKDIAGVAVPPPMRQNPSDIPMGFAKDAEISEMDIRSGLGMYNATVGERGNATSGIQENLQQKKGEVATFHYNDNLARAIRHIGRILVFAIPKVIDWQGVIRTLGVDGSAEMINVDPSIPKSVQKIGAKSIYNLGAGTYDVSVAVGPSFSTRRQEAAAGMSMLVQTNPAMWNTHGDLIAKSQDWPDADAFAERSRMLLPPEIRQQEDAKKQANGGQHPEVAAAMAQAKAIVDQSKQQMQQVIQGLQEKAKELDQQEQKLKDVMATIDKESQRLNYEKSLMAAKDSFTKQLVQAQEEAADAEQKAALTQAISKVEKIVGGYTDSVETLIQSVKESAAENEGAEQEQKEDQLALLLKAQHAQMMGRLADIVQPLVEVITMPRRMNGTESLGIGA